MVVSSALFCFGECCVNECFRDSADLRANSKLWTSGLSSIEEEAEGGQVNHHSRCCLTSKATARLYGATS